MKEVKPIINAAGKLTALGGSAQSQNVADAITRAAMMHVDLHELRKVAGQRIAKLTGAEAACLTTGAAAGITISVAGILTGNDLSRAQQLPWYEGEKRFLLQAGHDINFGAPVEQMIRLGGGEPAIFGATNSVPKRLLQETLNQSSCAGFLFVQSHHCVQENVIDLRTCIDVCHEFNTPVIVDAAAEEDLCLYIKAGADLVVYSGGKAFGGPTSGFIAGKDSLITACELQFQGIARTMKVGKEQIMGLLVALEDFVSQDPQERKERLDKINSLLLEKLSTHQSLSVRAKEDEAGRNFSRVAVAAVGQAFDIRDLVSFLAKCTPSIRTRNHHLDKGFLLIDPREITLAKAEIICTCISKYIAKL